MRPTRLLLLATLAIGVLAVPQLRAQTPPDKTLVGTWNGTGRVATWAMAKTGDFTLHIDRAGFYLQVFRDAQAFVVDWGGIYADNDEFWRKTSNGLEDRGGYARTPDGFAFTGAWSRFSARPASRDEAAAFARLSTLLRTPPKRTVEDWTARATALAALWRADAVLDDVALDKPGADGALGPGSTLTLRFQSASAPRRLAFRPTAGGGLESFFVAP